jgi:hypothetical protein
MAKHLSDRAKPFFFGFLAAIQVVGLVFDIVQGDARGQAIDVLVIVFDVAMGLVL